MAERTCLRCGSDCGTQMACDPCWKRIPTDLPGHRTWRSARRSLLQLNHWRLLEEQNEAIKAWLRDHALDGAR